MGLKQVEIAADRLANTLIGGYADEMISARAWRLQSTQPRWATARKWIDRLFFWDDNHCAECFEIERARKYAPSEYKL